MNRLERQPRLVERAYDIILAEICEGSLPARTHLKQEALAAQLGVSRQPIQQALLLLKNDGMVEEAGRRGLVVAPPNVAMMRQRYQVRAVLDGLAARLAAERCATDRVFAERVRMTGGQLIADGEAAIEAHIVNEMIARDIAFHSFIYEISDNPALCESAEPHWRFLKRTMGEVLRRPDPPLVAWRQHHDILDAIVAGDTYGASSWAERHVRDAANDLAAQTREAIAAH